MQRFISLPGPLCRCFSFSDYAETRVRWFIMIVIIIIRDVQWNAIGLGSDCSSMSCALAHVCVCLRLTIDGPMRPECVRCPNLNAWEQFRIEFRVISSYWWVELCVMCVSPTQLFTAFAYRTAFNNHNNDQSMCFRVHDAFENVILCSSPRHQFKLSKCSDDESNQIEIFQSHMPRETHSTALDAPMNYYYDWNRYRFSCEKSAFPSIDGIVSIFFLPTVGRTSHWYKKFYLSSRSSRLRWRWTNARTRIQ